MGEPIEARQPPASAWSGRTLLLPGSGHSSYGIMTSGIDTDPRAVRARFTPQESLAIRARVGVMADNPEERATCGN